jgi:Rha family phage regulatory protein
LRIASYLVRLYGLVIPERKAHHSKVSTMEQSVSVIPAFDFHKLVAVNDGAIVTDTFQIAEAFGKKHSDVLRAVDGLNCSEDFTRAHFCVAEKINKLGLFEKVQRYYQMDFSGFVMVAMSFTGKKAAQVKEAYINAFNWMTAQLKKQRESFESERNAVMLEFLKEKDVASMSGRLLNRWGKKTKPRLVSRIRQLEEEGQLKLLV